MGRARRLGLWPANKKASHEYMYTKWAREQNRTRYEKKLDPNISMMWGHGQTVMQQALREIRK